jgi:hypothetical protein
MTTTHTLANRSDLNDIIAILEPLSYLDSKDLKESLSIVVLQVLLDRRAIIAKNQAI